jgi:hypothetical protein
MGLETDEIVPYSRTGGDSRYVDSPEAKGYFSERLVLSPRTATASTHHRRDEQSNADGNLTGLFLLPVVLRMRRRFTVVSMTPRVARGLCASRDGGAGLMNDHLPSEPLPCTPLARCCRSRHFSF